MKRDLGEIAMRVLLACTSLAVFATAISSSARALDLVSIDSDAFPSGTDISNLFPGVTLSSQPNGGIVRASFSPLASTGTNVFASATSDNWSSLLRFRADFDRPVSFVSIDTIPDDSFDPAILEAFNSSGVRIASFTTSGTLGPGTPETASVSVLTDEIAFIIVGNPPSSSGNTFYLDNLQYASRCFVIDAIDDEFSPINDGTTADLPVLDNDECQSDTPISVTALPGDLLPDRGGSATTDGSAVSYAPAPGFVGFEQFTYTAQDAGLSGDTDPPTVDQDTATVVVNVLEDLLPTATDDAAATLQNQAVVVDVLENDTLGNELNEVSIDTPPSSGSATTQSDKTIRYTPDPNFFGEDRFEYRLTDANGDSAAASVTIAVFFVSGQVSIDVMPNNDGNNLNLRVGQGGAVDVAILSVGEFFDAPSQVDSLALKLGPREANIWGAPQIRDVDGDGDEDLQVKFLIQQTGIACGDTHVSLIGRTVDSRAVSGIDAINTFNCPRVRKRH